MILNVRQASFEKAPGVISSECDATRYKFARVDN